MRKRYKDMVCKSRILYVVKIIMDFLESTVIL